MRFRVDDTLEHYAVANEQDIQSVWETVKNKLNDNSRYISQVSFDGVMQSADYESILFSRYGEINEVQIVSVSEEQLIGETLTEIRTYSVKIINACDSIGNLFYGDPSVEQWDMARTLLEAVEWVIQSLSGIANLLSKYPEQVAYVRYLEESIRSLNDNLSALRSAMESEDYTAVGDVMKYELAETFKQLESVILASG